MRGSKKEKVLSLCREPKRFSDLLRESGASKPWLAEMLRTLIQKGFVMRLPDGRYVLTEKGKEELETYETLEIVKEAIKRYGAKNVREVVTQLMKKRIEEAVTEVEIVETLVRVLRAWATVTAYWLVSRAERSPILTERVGEEEKRALSVIEATLRKVSGEQWYRKHTILLYPHERAFIENRRGEEGIPVPLTAFIFQEGREKALQRAEEELRAVKQERLNLLETSLREAILSLLHLIEERKRELEALTVTPTRRGRKKERAWESFDKAATALSLWLYGTIIQPLIFGF